MPRTSEGARPVEINDGYRPRTNLEFLRRVVAAALREGGQRYAVSLWLTGDREIARLHRRHLGDPTPTDVMSFLVDDTVELVVSVERARRVARRLGHAIKAELALYVIHGILHACGHDDTRARARTRMRAAESRVLDELGLVVNAHA